MSDVQGVLGKDWHQEIRYPLIFPLTTGSKIGTAFIGVLIGALGIGVLYALIKNQIDPVGMLLFGLPALCVLFVPVYCFFYASRARMTVEADAIEVQKAFQTRRVATRDILGRRSVRTRNGQYQLIVTKVGSGLRVQTAAFGLDDRFMAWFNALPDLDEQDRSAMLAEVSRDASLGANPEERLATLASAKRLATGLNAVGVALSLWGFAYSQPYGLVIACAAALPWLGVVLLWTRPGLFQMDGRASDVKPNVGLLVLMPPVLLGMRAMLDLDIVDLQKLFGWGALAAVPLFLAIVAAPRTATAAAKGRGALVLTACLLSLAYGVSLLALTDTLLDEARPDVYTTAITGKNVSRGKSTTYYVNLAPWSNELHQNHIAVSRAYYDAVQAGDTVCVRLHPGKFGLRWLQLGGCG